MARLYRAVQVGYWNPGDPFPRNRALLARVEDGQTRYPAGRWNWPEQDAVYCSTEDRVAFMEVAQRFAVGTLRRQILDLQGLSAELVVFSFDLPTADSKPFDGRQYGAEWFLVRGFMEPRPEADARFLAYVRPQALAHALVESGIDLLVVPSVPVYWSERREAWNYVCYLGKEGQLSGGDLPTGVTKEWSALPEGLTS